MKAILITGCGCSKMIEIIRQLPEIGIPIRMYHENYYINVVRDGVIPDTAIECHERRFRLVDKRDEFLYYREY